MPKPTPPEGKRFRKGQSGNPSGRPKADFAAYCRSLTSNGKDLADFWRNVMDATPEAKVKLGIDEREVIRMQDRQRASELLATRGFGQPDAAVKLSGDGEDKAPVLVQVISLADAQKEPGT